MPKRNPTLDELDALLSQYQGTGGITLESLQAQHDLERKLACEELDRMAEQFAREKAEREKLWGNKFPPVLGALPPGNGKSTKTVNPVKAERKKRGKTKK